jgi:transposase-like protein
MGILTMSQSERKRLKIVEQIVSQKMTVKEGSYLIGKSERQTYRIIKRYLKEGDAGLIHRLRGTSSNRGYPEKIKKEVIRIYWQKYRDFGPTLFSEKLAEYHKISIHHETIRRWMRKNGIITSERKKRPHRRKRERKKAIGEMLQFDGSHHDWFEGRGSKCCLLNAVDDASGKVFLRLAPTESTRTVLVALRQYVELHGIPNSIYTDRFSVYYEENRLTDFGLAMEKLGIRTIFANSAEAKGRVERGNRTHQDRLVKEMRLRGISTIAEANKFLKEHFISDHNNRFASEDSLCDIHRSIEGYELDNIFCYETYRQVRNDYTIMLEGNYIQLENSETPLPCPKQNITVREYLDGSLHLFNEENELKFRLLKSKPKVKGQVIRKVKNDHPWKKHKYGKAKKR